MKKHLAITAFVSGLLIFVNCINVNATTNVGLIRNSTWTQNMTPVYYSALAFGDIDNDEDSDLILFGQSTSGDVAKIYINNGTTMLEKHIWQQNLLPMRDGAVSLGDVDNDGDLDLVTAGCISGGGQSPCSSVTSKLYINNGNSFIENSTWLGDLEAANECSLRFGDIDNDGDLDLALIGYGIGGPLAKIYMNNGASLKENQSWQQNIDSVYQGSVALGDIDNDGDLDLALTGDVGVEGKITKIYINDGTTFLESVKWGNDLLGVDRSSVILGDYDNDGDLDLALIGQFSADHLRFYINNGTTLLENQTQEMGGLEGYFRGSISWGDYDNDGDLDTFGIGKEHGRNWVYNNNANHFEVDFISSNDMHADDMQQGASTWVDIDNDNDIDLLASGVDTEGLLIKSYINNITSSGSPPSPPTEDFRNNFSNDKLNLSWGLGSDLETPVFGLYYNLRVGTCSGCHDIVSGVYGGSSGGGGGGGPAAGYFGNMMQRKSILLNRYFEPGTTIYWTVQTIDTGLAKSEWSEEQVYVIPGNESGNETNCTPSWSCSSWGVCQPSNTQTCDSWVDANNCNETYNGSDTRICTYDDGDSNDRPSSGSSSSYTPPAVQHTFDSIEPEVPATKELTDGVKVTIKVREMLSNVDMEARMTSERPTSITKGAVGNLYRYLEINSSGIADSDIEEAYIGFRVSRQWIDDNLIDGNTVTLHKYHGDEWHALETAFETADIGYYHYRARTTGFSYFAITGETAGDERGDNGTTSLLCTPSSMRCSSNELQYCSQTGTLWLVKELCRHGCDPSTKACITPETRDENGILWYFLGIIPVSAALAVAYSRLRKERFRNQ